MKRIILTLAAMFCLVSFAAAQETEQIVSEEKTQAEKQASALEPGLYAFVDGVPCQLPYSAGTTISTTLGTPNSEVTLKQKYTYKGTTSGLNITEKKLVMVIDPEQKAVKKSMKGYDPFIKSMTPDNIMIVRLVVEKNKRVYDAGASFGNIKLGAWANVEFEWKHSGDNAYMISVDSLQPGEYAVIFKPAEHGTYDLTSVFCFTVQ